jgi:hypothetical protein
MDPEPSGCLALAIEVTAGGAAGEAATVFTSVMDPRVADCISAFLEARSRTNDATGSRSSGAVRVPVPRRAFCTADRGREAAVALSVFEAACLGGEAWETWSRALCAWPVAIHVAQYLLASDAHERMTRQLRSVWDVEPAVLVVHVEAMRLADMDADVKAALGHVAANLIALVAACGDRDHRTRRALLRLVSEAEDAEVKRLFAALHKRENGTCVKADVFDASLYRPTELLEAVGLHVCQMHWSGISTFWYSIQTQLRSPGVVAVVIYRVQATVAVLWCGASAETGVYGEDVLLDASRTICVRPNGAQGTAYELSTSHVVYGVSVVSADGSTRPAPFFAVQSQQSESVPGAHLHDARRGGAWVVAADRSFVTSWQKLVG